MMSLMPGAVHAADVDTILTLPEHTGALAIAEACRDAATAFLRESRRWGKAELAMWLMGPYAMVAYYAPTCERRRSNEAKRPTPPLLREIDARMVERVIAAAHTEVRDALDGITDAQGAADFALGMIAAGFVARCVGLDGTSGWVPTTDARRLADRVLSLLAADYLTRPDTGESGLALWTSGGFVDPDRGSEHAPMSGVARRHSGGGLASWRLSTPPFLPEGA
jgi:hypothetical protein